MLKRLILASALMAGGSAYAQENTDISGANFQSGKADSTLAALGKQALRVLAIGAEPRKLQAGAVLYYAGDAADGGYLVQRGELLIEPVL